MSLRYRNQDGTEIVVGGLTPGGVIEAGAVSQRSGSFNIPATAASSTSFVDVTFTDEMPDSEYQVSLDSPATSSGSIKSFEFTIYNKTASGFSVAASRTVDVATTSAIPMNYTAWKTYTVQHAAQNAEDIAEIKQAMPSGAGSGNKLVTSSQLTNTTDPIATDVANLKDLVPVGASISNQLVTASQASVDDALSTTSEHAVQNKVVKAALDSKQDTLTFDNVPTASSNNPVKSSGIKSALDAKTNQTDIHNISNTVGAKNLFDGYFVPSTLIANREYTDTKLNRTIEYPDTDRDGSMYFTFGAYLNPGSYTLSVNGEDYLSFNRIALAGTACTNSSAQIRNSYDFTTAVKGWSYFSIERDPSSGGSTDTPFEGHDLKIMISLKDVNDTTYQESALSNMDLTARTEEIKSQINSIATDLVVKNILPNRGSGTTATSYGVTFTINSDGSVTANGTATGGQAIFPVCFSIPVESGMSYILSGGHNTSKFCYANAINGSTYVTTIGLSTGFDLNPYEQNPFTPDYDGYNKIEIGIAINNGQKCENEVFYPMVRLATIEDDSYVPYAKTNQELTSNIGTGTLSTSAQNIIGAINELVTTSFKVLYYNNSIQTFTKELEVNHYYLAFTYGGGYGNSTYCFLEFLFTTQGQILRIPIYKATNVSSSVSYLNYTVTCSTTTLVMGLIRIG